LYHGTQVEIFSIIIEASFGDKHEIIGYCVIPNNISDKTPCNFYHYIRSELVVLAPIIFWILTHTSFFILILKVNNNKLLSLL